MLITVPTTVVFARWPVGPPTRVALAAPVPLHEGRLKLYAFIAAVCSRFPRIIVKAVVFRTSPTPPGSVAFQGFAA